MIFNLIEDAITNALDIGESLIDGDGPSKRQVAKLISDGLTVAAIASATGLAIDVIQKMMEE